MSEVFVCQIGKQPMSEAVRTDFESQPYEVPELIPSQEARLIDGVGVYEEACRQSEC